MGPILACCPVQLHHRHHHPLAVVDEPRMGGSWIVTIPSPFAHVHMRVCVCVCVCVCVRALVCVFVCRGSRGEAKRRNCSNSNNLSQTELGFLWLLCPVYKVLSGQIHIVFVNISTAGSILQWQRLLRRPQKEECEAEEQRVDRHIRGKRGKRLN